jgi:hypothetical protein
MTRWPATHLQSQRQCKVDDRHKCDKLDANVEELKDTLCTQQQQLYEANVCVDAEWIRWATYVNEMIQRVLGTWSKTRCIQHQRVRELVLPTYAHALIAVDGSVADVVEPVVDIHT